MARRHWLGKIIDEALPHHRLSDGSYDKPGLRKAVEREFRTKHPSDVLVVEQEAVTVLIEKACQQHIATARARYAIGGGRAKRARVFTQIPRLDDPDQYDLKQRVDVTFGEARRALNYWTAYTRRGGAEMRFWAEVLRLGAQQGYGDDELIKRVVTEESA